MAAVDDDDDDDVLHGNVCTPYAAFSPA